MGGGPGRRVRVLIIVVWGMPREAVALGAAVQVLGLQEIPVRLRAIADSMDVTRAGATA
jgi:hypothetical protein